MRHYVDHPNYAFIFVDIFVLLYIIYMATNNYFDRVSGKIIQVPTQDKQVPNAPGVVIIDAYALGVDEYTISPTEFTSYDMTFIVAGAASIGTSIVVNLPDVGSVAPPQKITIKNISPDDVDLYASRVDADTYALGNYFQTLNIPNVSGNTSSISLIADNQYDAQWYITNLFIYP